MVRSPNREPTWELTSSTEWHPCKRILVLEDAGLLRKVVLRLLVSIGHEVSGASGGFERN